MGGRRVDALPRLREIGPIFDQWGGGGLNAAGEGQDAFGRLNLEELFTRGMQIDRNERGVIRLPERREGGHISLRTQGGKRFSTSWS